MLQNNYNRSEHKKYLNKIQNSLFLFLYLIFGVFFYYYYCLVLLSLMLLYPDCTLLCTILSSWYLSFVLVVQILINDKVISEVCILILVKRQLP
jgi:cellulose synthase/poly-beta-1,6-N-acetylglucosamine synthase-like glycosyltransferase